MQSLHLWKEIRNKKNDFAFSKKFTLFIEWPLYSILFIFFLSK